MDVFAAAPDRAKTGIDTRIVRHTCAPLFTIVETMVVVITGVNC
jgi:hypothetical protein